MAIQFSLNFSVNFIGDGTSSSAVFDISGYNFPAFGGGIFTKIKANNLPVSAANPGINGQNVQTATTSVALNGASLTFQATQNGSPVVFQSGVNYGFFCTLLFNSPLI